MVHALVVQNLSVRYGTNDILSHVSCHVPCNTIAAIVGPNGAGKSTLIKAILDFIPLSEGHISFFGLPLKNVQTKIAYIPQRADIDWDFPVTVYDVILMGRYPYIPWFLPLRAIDHEIAHKALVFVGLEKYRDVSISKLSGGQQQLCFLARAFAMQADLYILDEPFIGIDAPTEKKIITLLQNLRSQGKTVVIVHHDLYTLSAYFDWIICLNHTVVAQGKAEDILSDQNWIAKTYNRV